MISIIIGNEYIEIGVRVLRSYSANFELIVLMWDLPQLSQYIPPYFAVGKIGMKNM